MKARISARKAERLRFARRLLLAFLNQLSHKRAAALADGALPNGDLSCFDNLMQQKPCKGVKSAIPKDRQSQVLSRLTFKAAWRLFFYLSVADVFYEATKRKYTR